jgi:simple sugar transport system permease protein
LLWATGYAPLDVWRVLAVGAFGSFNNFAEVMLRATPLILMAVGLAVAFQGGVWNVGADGQFYLGAAASTAVALAAPHWPSAALVPLVLVTGVAAGALWGGLAGWWRARHNANEVVTTIMLNYIALFIISYLITGPMQDPSGDLPQSARLPEAARLWRLWPPTRLHGGVVFAVLLAALAYLFIARTQLGFALRALGFNASAARYAGMPVAGLHTAAMLISGGLAGLAGAVEVSGLTYRLYGNLSPGYGFTAIAVALLANNHPLGVVAAGVFFGALRSGAEVMQINAGVPAVVVSALQGLILLSVTTVSALRWRVKA